MNRIRIWSIALLCMASTFAAPALATDTLDAAKQRGALVVGVRSNLYPFGLEKDGKVNGYDIDFAQAIAAKAGLRLELRASNQPLIPQVMDGKVDLAIAALSKTARRADQVDFSIAYYVTTQRFLAPKGTIRSQADLAGKKIGVVRRSSSEINVMRWLPNSTAIVHKGYQDAFFALKDGRVDALSTDEAILIGLIVNDRERDEFALSDFWIAEEPYGIGVRKGSPKMLELVNRTLLEMEASGAAAKIYERWFGAGTPVPLPRTFRITVGR